MLPVKIIIEDAIIIGTAILVASVLTAFWRWLARRTRQATSIRSVTIFEHIITVIIWVWAAVSILRPVFGIDPTTVIAALGIGSLLFSLGLQDTIANIISGIILTTHRVVTPGDTIRVGAVEGDVRDLMLRHTVVTTKEGDTVYIPNSLLSKQSLRNMSEKNRALRIFTIRVLPYVDLDAVADDICTTADAALDALDVRVHSLPTEVYFQSGGSLGIEANIRIYLKSITDFDPAVDAVLRALKGRSYLADASTTDRKAAARWLVDEEKEIGTNKEN